MKKLHYLLPLASIACSSFGVEPSETLSSSIPFDQLGAAVQQQQPKSSEITATKEGAILKAAMQDLLGEVSTNGLLVTSTAEGSPSGTGSLSLKAVGISRLNGGEMVKSAAELSQHGQVHVTGDVASLLRPELVEEYRVSTDGIRQDFIVLRRPAGEDGDLLVELQLKGALAENAAYGVKLVMESSGRELAYSRLHVTDAKGQTLTARMEALGASHLRLVVEDKAAAYPVRIDPTFSDADWVSMGTAGDLDDTIRCMVSDENGSVYVGGYFRTAGGKPANRIARWDGTQWSALGSGMSGPVECMMYTNSTLYAGGQFITAGGVVVNRIAKWDGTSWSALGSGVDGKVSACVRAGPNLFIGGEFQNAGGNAAPYIAKWNGTSWSSVGGGMNDAVWSLTAGNNLVFAGGNFATAGGISAQYIAKWDGVSWSSVSGGTNGTVQCLGFADGTLYAGGTFTIAGSSTVNHIARWNGTAWAGFGSGANEVVASVAISGNEVYIGGGFTNAGGVTANRIAKWNGSSWGGLGPGVNGWVRALLISGGDLHVGGEFDQADGKPAMHLARWTGGDWQDSTYGADASVYCFAEMGGYLYAGGDFTNIGGISVGNIARWDGSTWSAVGDGLNSTVHTLHKAGGLIYAGGSFTFAGGVAAARVAKWNGTLWSPLGGGVNGTVRAITSSAGNVYVGGGFTSAGGVSANSVAKWNGTSWSNLGSGMSYPVMALVHNTESLYAGGYFTTAGGVPVNYIAKWNGTGWSALGSGVSGPVLALATSGTDLLVGGAFASAGSLNVNSIAKWAGGTWLAMGSGVDNFVSVISTFGSHVYVGGGFSVAGGVAASNIAHWDGSAWFGLGSGLNNVVWALAKDGNTVYAGGDFTVAGSKRSSYLAKVAVRESDIRVESPPTVGLASGGVRSFGSMLVNGSNITIPFIIGNTGLSPLEGLSITITGTGASQFAVVTPPVGPVAPNESTTFEVRFQPTSAGAKTALLKLANNDPDESPYAITLNASGIAVASAPFLVSPGSGTAPGSSSTSLTPTFTWKAVSGAVAYNFTLREAGGLLLHSETGIGATTSYALPAGHLKPGGRYQWTMQARNAGGPGVESAPFYFVVSDEPAAVPQPVLLTPGSADPSKTVLDTLTPTFRWKPVAGALGLTITLRDTGSNSDIPLLLDDAVGSGTTYTIAPGILQPDKSYRWTLRGRNGLGEGRWALPFYFSTAPAVTLPTAPIPVYPGGTSLAGATAYDPGALGAKPLEWKPVTGATGYKVKLWPAGAGAELHSADVAASATTYSLPTGLLTQNQACRWTVSTVAGGLESLPSVSRFFRTPAVYPAPEITSFRPAQAVASNSAQWVLLQGDDFRSGAKVLQTYGTKTDLLASSGNVQFYPAGIRVKIITGLVAGNWSFKIRNPDGQVSNAVTLPVVLPASTVLSAPVATPPPGTYKQPVSVVLSQDNGAGVNIHYTDNGNEPDLSSEIYDNVPILLGAKISQTLKAVCLDDTRTAARMVPATYRFNLPQLKFEASNEPMQFFAGDKYYYKVVVPAGLASFDLQTFVPQGRVDLYLAKDRLPTVESHQFKSVPEPGSGGDEVQAIRSQRVTAGTYFVLVHAKDSARVQIGMVATKGTVTAQPTISPGRGVHAAPLQVFISHPDPYATIYYTVDSSVPNPMAAKTPDVGNIGSGTLIYRGPFLLSSDATIHAVAQKAGQSLSKPVWSDFTMDQPYGFFDMPLTQDPVDIPFMVRTWSAEAPLAVSWSDKAKEVEHSFAFTIPADPVLLTGSPLSEVEYPVAMLFVLHQPDGVSLDVSLSASATLASSSQYPISVKKLPVWDLENTDSYVLGPKQANQGAPLVPGNKYYGRIKIKGSKQAALNTVMAKLRMTLHYASLSNEAGPIQPGKRTWMVAHGRSNTDLSPDIVDLGDALDTAISGRPQIGEQVLRLNWGSMALDEGDPLESAMFTEAVGRRSAELMKKWSITPDKCSLIGHSWGTYVCYELAKNLSLPTNKVARLIALDPARTGFGGYADSKIRFDAHAARSWSFVCNDANGFGGGFGNPAYAATAHESFYMEVSAPPFPTTLTYQYQCHSIPLEFFTQCLTRNYGGPTADQVAQFFSIANLDAIRASSTGSIISRFRIDRWPRLLQVGSIALAGKHEGLITVGLGPTEADALDDAAPVTLQYTDSTGVDRALPLPP